MFKFRSEVNDFAIEEDGRLGTIKRSWAGVPHGSIHHYRSEHITSFRLRPLTAGEVQKPPESQQLLHFIASTTSTSHFTLAVLERYVQHPGQFKLSFAVKQCGMLFGDSKTFGGLGPRDGRQREIHPAFAYARLQGFKCHPVLTGNSPPKDSSPVMWC
jgi:hypothetical protein